MMRAGSRFPIAFVTVALVLADVGLAQERPSFTGTWVASSAPQRLRITQDASQLTVTDSLGTRERTLVYRLDGSDSRNETRTVTGEKWTNVSHATWVSSALAITTTTTRESTGRSWDWMTIYLRDGSGNLEVTTIDAVLDQGPFMNMAQSTVVYASVPARPVARTAGSANGRKLKMEGKTIR
jgi:hypothetical protein